jgi:adenylyltransferase/sulfurtransferase
MPLTDVERARYDRHLSLPEIGVDGQQKLKAARVLVVGAGGLGSPSALYLAAAGVGTLGLVDCDRVELSNLQRQVLFDTADIARAKTAAARERLTALNPEISVVAHEVELRAANVLDVLRDYDVVLDGTDRLATRYLVNDACVILGKPLVTAAIHRFEGQAMTYIPGRGPCYRCLFPETPVDAVPSCAEAGVLGVLPGVLGAIQATEAIKLIVGAGEPLIGRLLAYDALEMRFDVFRVARREDCAVCGEHPSILKPEDLSAACTAHELRSVRRLTPRELQVLLSVSADRPGSEILVDVRQPREFAAGHLPDAINIPVAELPARIAEIPAGATPVFMCRSGARSLAACGIALRTGIAAPAQLEGGLLAWARDVDPGLVVAPAS